MRSIAKAALEKPLAVDHLVQEPVDGKELIFLPSLKRAEERIAALLKNLYSLPSSGLSTRFRC